MGQYPNRAGPVWRTSSLLAVAFAILCLGPHLDRLRHPSVFADDLARIKDLQTKPLTELLFRPFQEHMAPLFEIVSWVTWQAAGRKLSWAPLAFTLASYVPFIISLWLLGRFLYRELESASTALVAVAAYSLSALHVEAVYWYSASSFFWAMVWTLITLSCAAAAKGGGRSSLVWAALAAALAPASSAIGLLAGPLGAIRLAATPGPPGKRVRVEAIVPIAGTLANLAICSSFRYHHVLATSLKHRADFAAGLTYVFCATTNVLIPGLFGFGYIQLGSSTGVSLAIAIVGLVGVLVWAWRSERRALILGSLWLILGGYTITYCFRTQQFGLEGLFKVERYHVFPLLGFVIGLAIAIRPWLGRCDRRPVAGLCVATMLAAMLMVTHLPGILSTSRYYDFPTQHLALSALERVDEICRREGITRDQVLTVLDPISSYWSRDQNPLAMLPEPVRVPARSNDMVRQLILEALPPDDREAIWGGMDVSAFLKPVDHLGSDDSAITVGRLVGRQGVRKDNEGRFVTKGWPSFLEFEWPVGTYPRADQALGGRAPAPALCLPSDYGGSKIEVWWADQDDRWSQSRSILWRPVPSQVTRDLAVSLDRLPHWDSRSVRRIRIMFRSKAAVVGGAPRLLR